MSSNAPQAFSWGLPAIYPHAMTIEDCLSRPVPIGRNTANAFRGTRIHSSSPATDWSAVPQNYTVSPSHSSFGQPNSNMKWTAGACKSSGPSEVLVQSELRTRQQPVTRSAMWSPRHFSDRGIVDASTAVSESCSQLGEAAVGALARRSDRLRRSGRRPDRHKTHIVDADKAERLAQIGRRHVDPATVHAGYEIAAACQDDDRWPVLEQRQVSSSRIEAERQSGLRDHVDPVFQLVGNAEVPHRSRNQHAIGECESKRDAFGDREAVALRIAKGLSVDARILRFQDRAIEFRQVIPPEVHQVDVPVRPGLREAVEKDARPGGGLGIGTR